MREIRGEIEACLKQLELFQENFNKAAANRQERHLYCSNRNGKPSFSVATDNNGFHAPTRKSINGDRDLMEELLAVKLGEIAEKHVARDICHNIDGSLDMRIVEAEIRNKLMKWLLLE